MSKPDISKVKVGDKVYGWWEKRAYNVIAKNDIFVVITKVFNFTKALQIWMIDIKRDAMRSRKHIVYDEWREHWDAFFEQCQLVANRQDESDGIKTTFVPVIDFDKIVSIE